MTVVYVAGPFRAANAWEIAQNINRAATAALEVWLMGAVAICPHLNSAPFQGAAPDLTWLTGYLELLERSDVVLMLPGWEQSRGASAEYARARQLYKPIVFGVDEAREWLTQKSGLSQ